MVLEEDRLGTGDFGRVDPSVVPKFLLGPDLDHLPWIRLAITTTPPVFTRNILVTVLKDQDGRLVNLDGVFWTGRRW